MDSTASSSSEVDPIMSILTSKIIVNDEGEWRLVEEGSCSAENCLQSEESNYSLSAEKKSSSSSKQREGTKINSQGKKNKKQKKKTLDCGKAVNSTHVDHLRGVAGRHSHPHIAEPEVSMILRKKSGKEVNLEEIERKLKKSVKEKPNSASIYNQIGNLWRVKGDTYLAIECFRKALALSPRHSDALLNLARVLFNLHYLDDAIQLTRQSLDAAPQDQNTWLQHFTLGEILKAYGHNAEAQLHLKHALDLNPGFGPAQAHLKELNAGSDATVTYYTLFIILFLVLGVLCGILTSIDSGLDDSNDAVKTQRHFNRAMAMRSIKLGINPKLIKMRKQCTC